jgi:sulfoxide reductase heme-binding subunit YedZ
MPAPGRLRASPSGAQGTRHWALGAGPRGLGLLKAFAFVLLLLPAIVLAYGWVAGTLGANPIDETQDETGTWALTCLILSLAVTPVRRLTGWNGVIRFRRMFGLFAFFYAALHFLNYLVLDQFFAWDFIVADVAKRPYITVGFTAFLLLVPLALTSTAGWIRRLGGRRWRALHRLAYVAAIGGVVHYWWLVKADITGPLQFAAVLAVLFGVRGYFAIRGSGDRGIGRSGDRGFLGAPVRPEPTRPDAAGSR